MLAFEIHIFWLCTKKRIRFRWKQELLKLDKSLYRGTSRIHQNNIQTCVHFLWNTKNQLIVNVKWLFFKSFKKQKRWICNNFHYLINILNLSNSDKHLCIGKSRNIYSYINIVCGFFVYFKVTPTAIYQSSIWYQKT